MNVCHFHGPWAGALSMMSLEVYPISFFHPPSLSRFFVPLSFTMIIPAVPLPPTPNKKLLSSDILKSHVVFPILAVAVAVVYFFFPTLLPHCKEPLSHIALCQPWAFYGFFPGSRFRERKKTSWARPPQPILGLFTPGNASADAPLPDDPPTLGTDFPSSSVNLVC